MLAFKDYHSVIEMKRYMVRFLQFQPRMEKLDGILHTKYNEFDSIIDPILHWLRDKGVHFVPGTVVTDLVIDEGCTAVTAIIGQTDGKEFTVPVAEKDMVISTLGSMTQNSTAGDNTHPVVTDRQLRKGFFSVREKLAARDEKFGHPEKFTTSIDKTKWMSAMVTVKGYKQFVASIREKYGYAPGSHTGAISFIDSGWDITVAIYDKYYTAQEEARAVEAERLRKFTETWYRGLFEASENAQKSPAKKGGEVKYSFDEYSEKQKQNWSNSKRIVVYEGELQLRSFIRDALSIAINNKKMYFGRISSALAKRIVKEVWINVEGYNCSLAAYEIKKIKKDHGNEEREALRGQREVTEDDYVPIPTVILEADSITLSDKLYNGRPVINFIKTVNESRITVSAYVSDKHLDLAVQTMFAGKKKGNLSTPIGEQAPINTPEANSGTVSNDSILDSSGNSKPKFQEREDLPEDRELLMTAKAEGRNAETLEKYQKKVKALEALERKQTRQQEALEKARKSKNQAAVQEWQEKIQKTEESILRAQKAYQKAHGSVYRRGSAAGVPEPSGHAGLLRRTDQAQLCVADHDALHHLAVHAAQQQGRPAARHPRGKQKLCLHWAVCGAGRRCGLHRGDQRLHRDDGGLRPNRDRPQGAAAVSGTVRCTLAGHVHEEDAGHGHDHA